MKRLIPVHIQHQLLLLVIVAMLPQFCIIVYQNLRELEADSLAVREKALGVADTVTIQQKNIEYASRQLLTTLAIIPEVRKKEVAECDRIFAELIAQNPQYYNVGGVNTDGTLFASGVQGVRVSVAERKYFQDAMKNSAFSVGEYVISKTVSRPAFHFALPVEGDGGGTDAVLFVATDLRYSAGLVTLAGLPHGSEVSVYDHAGRRLFTVPEKTLTIGVPLPDEQLAAIRKGAERGVISGDDSSGEPGIIAYRRVAFDGAAPYLFVRVVVPEKAISEPANEKMQDQLLKLGLATVIALLIAWFMGDFLISRKMKRVIAVAEILGHGDLEKRTGIEDDGGEAGSLAHAIDRLGDSLSRDNARSAAAEDELRILNAELEDRVHERTMMLEHRTMLLETVSEASNDGILMLNDEGKAIHFNRRFADICGVPQELMDEMDASKILESVSSRLKSPQQFIRKIVGLDEHPEQSSSDEIELADGRILDSFSSLLVNTSGNHLGRAWFFRDITGRKQMERQLIQSHKLESVGRLAGGIAHDFNNKLSVIIGYTELVREELPDDSSVADYLTEIRRAADFSRDITDQLLSFSRQQIIDPRVVDLNRVINESLKPLFRLIGEDVQLVFEPDDALWNIRVDPVQIDQILMNLVVNARDAMPDGGTLTVETANFPQEVKEDEEGESPGGYVRLSVSDTGIGMDEETRRNIFEPFFTTKEVGKGTGLGLAMIHGIVSQNGGYCEVKSAPGKGAAFHLYFPRVIDSPDERPALPETSSRKCSGSILLVEDDESVRKMTTLLLERSGYTVTQCAGPMEALQMYEQENAGFDLIVSDIIMPGMNGREMAERIRGVKSDIKVLFMSGYSAEVISEKGVCAENIDFIAKPIVPDELMRKIGGIVTS